MSKNNKSEINENLLLAIKNGDLTKIDQLFKQGANPNYCVNFFDPNISEIFLGDKLSETKKIEMIILFLVNKVKFNFFNPIHLNQIVESGYEDLAKILIINAKDINYPLRQAMLKGYDKLVSLILNIGIELTQADKDLLPYQNVNEQIKTSLSQAINTDKLFDGVVTTDNTDKLFDRTVTSELPSQRSSYLPNSKKNLSNTSHNLTKAPEELMSGKKTPTKHVVSILCSGNVSENSQKFTSEDKHLSGEIGRNDDHATDNTDRLFDGTVTSESLPPHIQETMTLLDEMSRDDHETELPIPHGPVLRILARTSHSSRPNKELMAGEKAATIYKDKSEILLERFNAILSKKVSNVFKSCIYDKLAQNLIDAFPIKTTEKSNEKIDKNNLINSLHNLLVKVVNNLREANFFKNSQEINVAEEVFDSNEFLKLYFGDFKNFEDPNYFKPSLKFLAGMKLLSDKYISIINGHTQNNITNELNDEIKEYLKHLGSALMTNEDFLKTDSMFKYICGEQPVLSESQSVIIGENTPDYI